MELNDTIVLLAFFVSVSLGELRPLSASSSKTLRLLPLGDSNILSIEMCENTDKAANRPMPFPPNFCFLAEYAID